MRLFALVAVLLLAGCASPPERAPDDSSELPISLAADSFYVGQFTLEYDARVRVSVNVTEGGPVDVWIGYGATCSDWLTAAFQPVRTAFSVNETVLETSLPKGEACVPIDNTEYAPGTANSAAPVELVYRVDLFRR